MALVLLFAPLPLLHVWFLSQPACMAGAEGPQAAARRQFETLGNASLFAAWEAINALPEGAKTLWLGDAQTFYLDRTPEYSVVFNQPLLEKVLAQTQDAATAAKLLAAHGITHLYLNYSEWFRLDTSYALVRGEPAPPADGVGVGVGAGAGAGRGGGGAWNFARPRLGQERLELLRQALYTEPSGGLWGGLARRFLSGLFTVDAGGLRDALEVVAGLYPPGTVLAQRGGPAELRTAAALPALTPR